VSSTGRSRRSCAMIECRIASSPRLSPPYEPEMPMRYRSLAMRWCQAKRKPEQDRCHRADRTPWDSPGHGHCCHAIRREGNDAMDARNVYTETLACAAHTIGGAARLAEVL